ncbi:MAG: hypothetical protein GX802_00500 [Clostridiales bacterium]|nr:hypothetical protein [Clostridiales bacterium]
MDSKLIMCILEVAEVGRDTLGCFIKKSVDCEFRSLMAEEFAEFQDISRNTMEYAARSNINFKSSKRFKANPFSGLKLGTFSAKKSPSCMAEMLIINNTIGLIDIKRGLKEFNEANEETKSLAYHSLDVVNKNIQELLSYV